MTNAVIFEEQIEIPTNLRSLGDFRRWALSESFPDCGRIDYIARRIEVDMSPEDLYCHGTLKTELVRSLAQRIKREKLGDLLSDRSRVSCVQAGLSAEPDIVFVSRDSVSNTSVRLVPKVTAESSRYFELEGAPDLIVEIVSDHSVVKDTQRLPQAYFRAGIREFWLIDARGQQLLFQIHSRSQHGFEPVSTDADGFQQSKILGCRYRLHRSWELSGRWEYDLLGSNG